MLFWRWSFAAAHADVGALGFKRGATVPGRTHYDVGPLPARSWGKKVFVAVLRGRRGPYVTPLALGATVVAHGP